MKSTANEDEATIRVWLRRQESTTTDFKKNIQRPFRSSKGKVDIIRYRPINPYPNEALNKQVNPIVHIRTQMSKIDPYK